MPTCTVFNYMACHGPSVENQLDDKKVGGDIFYGDFSFQLALQKTKKTK